MKKTISFLLLVFISKLCWSGTPASIPVYADVTGNDSIRQAVKTLFGELSKAGFAEYKTYPARQFSGQGILLTTRSAMVGVKASFPSKLKEMGAEGIYITGTVNSIRIIGNSALALQEAVYLYLDKLGFRYFLPGDTWTIIPGLKTVFKQLSVLTEPDYEYRSISIGYGFNNSAKLQDEYNDWYKANLLGGAFQVGMGHVYDLIVLSNKNAFEQHPEWYAGNVKKGETPPNPKFNVANKDLVSFVGEYALKKAESNIKIGYPDLMLSMDPSDGGGFCESPECLKIGGPSEQTYFLANAAAKKIRSKYPNIWVGVGAYSQYIVPPKMALEPNIYVMLTTAFNPSPYSTEELIGLWTKKAKKVGIYEFLSFYDWDFDIPGRSIASNIPYLQSSIKRWYAKGVRSYLAESTLGYVTRGLGHYVTAKMLWNVNSNIDSITNDFFQKAFENAAPLMKKLHAIWETYPYEVPSENDLAIWLDLVNSADAMVKNRLVKKRITDYKAYLHYLALYMQLQKNKSREKMIEVLNYAWRSFYRPSFSTLPVMATLPAYVGFRELRIWYADDQPWKTGKQDIQDAEIQTLFMKNLQLYKKKEPLTTFSQPRSFKTLPDDITVKGKKYETSLHTFINATSFVIEVKKTSVDNKLVIESGYSATLTGKVDILIRRFNDAAKTVILQYGQTEKNKTDRFSLASLSKGIYEVTIKDPNKSFKIEFAGNINYCVGAPASSSVYTSTVWGYNIFYIHVPGGIKSFELFTQGSFYLQSPSGRLIDHNISSTEVINIEVQKNEAGLWKMYGQFGKISLSGVPPYLGIDPSNMLIPVY